MNEMIWALTSRELIVINMQPDSALICFCCFHDIFFQDKLCRNKGRFVLKWCPYLSICLMLTAKTKGYGIQGSFAESNIKLEIL